MSDLRVDVFPAGPAVGDATVLAPPEAVSAVLLPAPEAVSVAPAAAGPRASTVTVTSRDLSVVVTDVEGVELVVHQP